MTDAGLKQSIRPIQDSELLRLYGFPEDFAIQALKFSEKEKAVSKHYPEAYRFEDHFGDTAGGSQSH